MAKKKTKEIEVLPVPQEPPKSVLVLEGDPEAQLAFATKAANALMTVVSKKKNPVMINGKQYIEYGDWQVLGRFYGATVEIEWTKPIFDHLKSGRIIGYEARALVTRNGEVISSAEGMCMRDERRWVKADEYAIRSMAQTRTAAKALRNAFGWVAELAGYAGTPAEEMPREPQMKPYNVGRPLNEKPREKIARLLRQGWKYDVVGKDREEVNNKIIQLTDLTLEEYNYPDIIERLEALIAEGLWP